MSESNTVTNRESDPNYRSVKVERVDKQRYRATNSEGASVEFGQGEGLLNPVEMLLAAIAGCSAIDVDVVTSRRSEPEVFEVKPSAMKVNEDGAMRLDDVEVSFNVKFPQDAKGEQATQLVDRLMKLSHEKDCTVSRTVEHGANVRFINENAS